MRDKVCPNLTKLGKSFPESEIRWRADRDVASPRQLKTAGIGGGTIFPDASVPAI